MQLQFTVCFLYQQKHSSSEQTSLLVTRFIRTEDIQKEELSLTFGVYRGMPCFFEPSLRLMCHGVMPPPGFTM